MVRDQMEALVSDAGDPEVAALGVVIGALTGLPSDEARQRVVDFATARFGLSLVSRGKTKQAGVAEAIRDPSEGLEEPDDNGLYAKFDHKKPAENVALIVARHYSLYGTNPFTVAQIQEQAAAAGLTVPNRIDMTLNSGGKKGKSHYQRLGKGAYRVTVHGEAFLKSTYDVRKGRRMPSTEGEG